MEPKRILRSVGIISAFTLFSRFLGLARDILMAGFFGTSLPMSAFVVAFTIPNLFRRLFGEGALSAAFLPVLVETREKDGPELAWKLANKIITLTGLILILITAVIILGASVGLLLPGLSAKTALTLSLLRIMVPYMIFICLAAVSMGVLNSLHHFAVSAFAPAILNACWILAVVFVVPRVGNTSEEKIYAVAWAILLAGFLQWAVQWPVLRRFGWRPKFYPELFQGSEKNPRIRKIMLLMGPAALGMAVSQVNVMIDRLLAIWIGPAAPAALFFSERLIYFPLGIFATALGTVLLPVFSRHAATGNHEEIRLTISRSLKQLFYVMLPAAAGLFVLATPVVQMIFEWKTFDASSTWMTAIALQCYAPGLIVFSLAKIFVPAFYAMQDTRTPVRIAIYAVLINIALNILFILTLPQAVKHAGIAAATVLSEGLAAVALALVLQKRIGRPDWGGLGRSLLRYLPAAVLMCLAVVWTRGWIFQTLEHVVSGKSAQIGAVVGAVIAGMLVYLIASILLCRREAAQVFNAVLRRKG
jgi:putative peptidoglycan lipid II flippase